jgi:hypothetical protein
MLKLNETCKICGRVCFGDIVLLPVPEGAEFRAWRHDACAIGSEDWALRFAELPAAERAKLAELHRLYIGVSVHYTQPTHKEG